MKFEEETIDFPYVCGFVGQSHLKLTPEIKEKTKKALLWQINEGRKYFFFGTLGPWERFCFEELKKLQKQHTNIRLVHFRIAGEKTFTEEEAKLYEEIMEKEGKKKTYLCFDGIYDCSKELFMGMFPMVSFDRMRTMFKRIGICLAWFEYEPNEKPPKDVLKKARWFKLLEYQPDTNMAMISYDWAKGMKMPTINLAKQDIEKPQ